VGRRRGEGEGWFCVRGGGGVPGESALYSPTVTPTSPMLPRASSQGWRIGLRRIPSTPPTAAMPLPLPRHPPLCVILLVCQLSAGARAAAPAEDWGVLPGAAESVQNEEFSRTGLHRKGSDSEGVQSWAPRVSARRRQLLQKGRKGWGAQSRGPRDRPASWPTSCLRPLGAPSPHLAWLGQAQTCTVAL